MRQTPRAAFVLAAVFLASCSLIVGSDSVQCSNDEDCRGRGGAFASTTCLNSVCVYEGQTADGAVEAAPDVAAEGAPHDAAEDASDGAADPWSCIGKAAPPMEDTTRSVTISYQFVDGPSMTPEPGMLAMVCGRANLDCVSPIASPQTTDSNGIASWSVPYAARIFLKVTGSDYLTTLVFVDPPPTMPQAKPLAIGVLTVGDIEGLTSLSPYPYNASEGTLVALTQDCQFGPLVSGVRVGMPPSGDGGASDTFEFYLVGGTPDLLGHRDRGRRRCRVRERPSGAGDRDGVSPAAGQRAVCTERGSGAGEYGDLYVHQPVRVRRRAHVYPPHRAMIRPPLPGHKELSRAPARSP